VEFLLAMVVVAIVWAVLSARIRRLGERLNIAEEHRAALTKRIWHLEQTLAAGAVVANASVAEPEVAPMAASAAAASVMGEPLLAPYLAPVPEREVEFIPEPPARDGAWPEVMPAAVAPEPPAPRIPWRQRLEGTEWEALVGGNLLNKLGVLVLIIGIALFLGYSFTQMGPVGRVATALAVSGALLGGGIALERREQYRIFSSGLIGGGWAALYFTVYAAHALPAARVIESPWMASVLLAAVAAGIIAHSLKYRSQAVTGLAYFVAFATFALTPVTTFSVLALLPLAGSLLYLAHRFEWYRMALFGVLATYATCASRGDSGSPVLAAQSVVGAYWLLFELFVILRASRPGRFALAEQWIFPLNTLGLVALSVPKWLSGAPGGVWKFAAGLALAHVVGALIRGRVRHQAADAGVVARVASGGYEGPITVGAAALVVAMFLRLDTIWINFGLLVEAQILIVAGLRLGHVFLQRLGGAVLGVSVAKLVVNDAAYGPANHWTPVALVTAAAMYLDRYWCKAERYFSYGAALAVALVLGYQAPRVWVIAAWFGLAVVLAEFGLRRRLLEFRFQAYGAALAAAMALVANNVSGAGGQWRWVPLGVAAALAYWLCLRVARAAGLHALEQRIAPLGLSVVTTLCALVFAGFAAPSKFIGAAWVMLAALMLELGLRGLPKHFERLAYFPLAFGWLHVVITGVADAQKSFPLVASLNVGVAALFSYAIAARVFRIGDRERRILHAMAAGAGTLFGAAWLWIVLPHPAVAAGWAALSLALIEAGLAVNGGVLKRLGDLLAAATFGRLFFANFVNLGSTAGVSHRLLTTAPVIAAWYYAWFRRREDAGVRNYLWGAAIAAAVLMRFELGRALAIVGWAGLCFALFWMGTRLGQFDLRIQAYLLAVLCFWRGLATNFYVPESLTGSAGRIAAAGFVVLALHGAQFLAPRAGFDVTQRFRVWRWLEQHPRVLFSLLATVLVSILLRNEVSGGMLTVAWGIQAVVLLGAGFWARERVLRLAGLALFLLCILKLFLYDLRHLETMNRILSFIVLGGVMVGVSWIYTRFRNQIQKFL
jgi:uncharacterized membrane protein